MNTSPLVTIITPTYNRGDLLAETMDSVLSQDYSPIEYIVIDDGSTDNTKEIVKKFQKIKIPGKKIIYVQQKNLGETASVNRGLKLAKGKFIGIINSDDPLLPHAVKIMTKYLMNHKDLLVVYPDIKMIDKNSNKINIGHVHEYNYLSMLKNQGCIIGQGAFFRSKVVELTNGRDKSFKFVADFDFWLRLGMYGEFARVPRVLATGRVHQNSQTEYAWGDEMAEEHIRLVKKIFSLKDLPREAHKFRRYAYSQAYHQAGGIFKSKKKMFWSYIIAFWYHPLNVTLRFREILRRYKRKRKNDSISNILGNIIYYLGELF